MMLKKNVYRVIVAAVFCILAAFPAMAQEAKKFKVLSVMSYDEAYPWGNEIKQGIDSAMNHICEVKYFYLDTKRNLSGGDQKAKEAYALYQEFRPDGVIAADDNAQTMFVIPYLKDKVKTPVMFCGVNEEIQTYGYPTSNITGVIEIVHFRESISFVQQLVPSVKNIGYIMLDRSTAKGFLQQFNKEKDTYPAKSVDFRLVQTLKEAISTVEGFKTR